jgi:hypothetical protein
MVDEDLINWGADTQRNLAVTFYIYYSEFGANQIGGGPAGAFGYYGDPSVELVPATAWPDLTSVVLLTSDASLATQIDLVFDSTVVLQGGSYAGGIIVKVNDDYVVPTTVIVGTTDSTVTLPAASIANGDTVEISISGGVYEDASANAYAGVNNFVTTNSVP